ncbi:MAG: hypothetical protein QXS00_09900 [Pyrobaculum sp.]|uniref:hypothetical protein n=1 Tax=Pyrobaculum sp. TaxID=2004705 RepID=UPI003164AA28
MVKWRYLIIRSEDPALCYVRFLERYQLAGFASLVYTPRLVAIFDNVLVLGVPRELVRKARAIVALLDGCYTARVAGTMRRAKAVAASIRKFI